MYRAFMFEPRRQTQRGEKLQTASANNKGADQPAHPRRLINAFVVRYLKSIIT